MLVVSFAMVFSGLAIGWSWVSSIANWAIRYERPIFCTQWMYQSPFQSITWTCEDWSNPLSYAAFMIILAVASLPIGIGAMTTRKITALLGIPIVMVATMLAILGNWIMWDFSNTIVNWVASKAWPTFCANWSYGVTGLRVFTCWAWTVPLDISQTLVVAGLVTMPIPLLLLAKKKTIAITTTGR